MFYFDQTYILVIIGVILCSAASIFVDMTFNRYSSVVNKSELTGRDVAEKILKENNIYDVRVDRVSGHLTDHYDPKNKVLRLSNDTYDSASISAIAVAAHECGHAIQHSVGYRPIAFRNGLIPFVNLGNKISFPLIIIGMFFNGNTGFKILMAGVICFSFAVLFQIATLPVEINASKRALKQIESLSLMDKNEISYGRKVLGAAAMTYVAGVASSLLQLLRLFLIAQSRSDD